MNKFEPARKVLDWGDSYVVSWGGPQVKKFELVLSHGDPPWTDTQTRPKTLPSDKLRMRVVIN